MQGTGTDRQADDRAPRRFIRRLGWVCLWALSFPACWSSPSFQAAFLEENAGDDFTWLALLLGQIASDGAGSSANTAGTFAVRSDSVGGTPMHMVCDSNYAYIVGVDTLPGNTQWRLEKRSLADGSLDTGFATSGVLSVNPSSNSEELRDIVLDSTYMYLVGSDMATGDEQWRIEKRSIANGSLASGFGSGGVVTNNPNGSQTDGSRAVELSPDGLAIYVAGSESTGSTAQRWRVEKRLISTGALDTGFNGSGVVSIDAGDGTQSIAYQLEVDSTYMYLGGSHRGGSVMWRVDKRFLSDGSAETAFSSDGQAYWNPSAGRDEGYQLLLYGGAVYQVGSKNGTTNDFLAWKIDGTTGSDDASFGSSGKLQLDPAPSGVDEALGLVTGTAGLYLVGRDYSNGTDDSWYITLRDSSTGAAVSSFGTAGVLRTDITSGNDRARAACISGEYLFVAGEEGTSPASWRLEKRHLSSGAQD